MHEFDREMRRVATRAAVSHRKHASAPPVNRGDGLCRFDERGALFFKKAGVGFAQLSRLLIDGTQQGLAELGGILTFPVQERIKRLQVTLQRHERLP